MAGSDVTGSDVAGRSRERVHYRRQRSGPIDASSAAVWPWLVQMGFDRGGWYAIDRLEKAFGVGRFATGGSARRVEPALQDLAVGDRMPLSRSLWLDVVVMEAPHTLEMRLPPGWLTWTWRFTLVDIGRETGQETGQGTGQATGQGSEGGPARCELTITTELSVPARRAPMRGLARFAFAVFDVGHGVMERVQLRTLARRVPASGE